MHTRPGRCSTTPRLTCSSSTCTTARTTTSTIVNRWCTVAKRWARCTWTTTTATPTRTTNRSDREKEGNIHGAGLAQPQEDPHREGHDAERGGDEGRAVARLRLPSGERGEGDDARHHVGAGPRPGCGRERAGEGDRMTLEFEIVEHPTCVPEDFPGVEQREGWQETTGKGHTPFDAAAEAYENFISRNWTTPMSEIEKVFNACVGLSGLSTCLG